MTKFKRRLNTEVRRQEKLDLMEGQDSKREELPERYIAKILYG